MAQLTGSPRVASPHGTTSIRCSPTPCGLAATPVGSQVCETFRLDDFDPPDKVDAYDMDWSEIPKDYEAEEQQDVIAERLEVERVTSEKLQSLKRDHKAAEENFSKTLADERLAAKKELADNLATQRAEAKKQLEERCAAERASAEQSTAQTMSAERAVAQKELEDKIAEVTERAARSEETFKKTLENERAAAQQDLSAKLAIAREVTENHLEERCAAERADTAQRTAQEVKHMMQKQHEAAATALEEKLLKQHQAEAEDLASRLAAQHTAAQDTRLAEMIAEAERQLEQRCAADRASAQKLKDINAERDGEVTKVAEETLQAKRGSLKSSDTTLKQQLPSNDDINAEKSAETDAGEILLTAKRKLSRTATAEKSSLPTAEDIAGEKKDKSCAVISSADLAKSKAAAATYSADEVEKLIVKFEKAAAKQIEKAPEDIATAKKEDLKVSLISAENGLMAATEQIRDVCGKAVAGTTPAERDFLDEVFGRGCNCERFTRIREVLTKVTLSKTSASDPRWTQVGDKMDTIEDILSQRGSFKAPVVKPPPVVVTVPKSFEYPQFEQSAGYPNPNDGSYVIGEDVMLEPELDGYAASFSVDRALPAGLVLDTTTGTISGSPTDATSKGPYVITATNEAGSINATISFGVTQPAPTAVKYESLNEKYMVGSRVESAPQVEGGACSSFSVSPDLPNAIALNSITGELSGVASDPSPHTTYQITGQNDRGKAVFDFAFAVTEPAPTSLSYPDMKDQYLLDSSVECQAQVGGGQCTTFSVEPPLPGGISLDARTGQISGTASEEAKTATYKVTANNTAGQAIFELRLAVFKPREDVLKKICECTDVQELLAMDPGKEQLDSWMVWNVHRAHLNDPSLVELDFTGLEMPLPQQQEKIAPKLMKALELHNTNLVTLKLGSSNLQRDSGSELADALAVNKTLKTIIVESNDLDYESIQNIAVKLTGNSESVVEQLTFGAISVGAATETALVQLMKDRHTIIKLGVLIKDAGNRNNIDRYTIQNVDRARRLAAGGGAEDLGPAEDRPCSALMLCAPPDGKVVGEVFADDEATVAIIIAFIAQNLMVPTKDQLMSFAKTQDKSVPFAKAAPAMKAFVKSLLDAVVGTQVVVTDAYGTDASGHSFKAWSAPTENDWTFETIDAEGKLIANKINKQPPIKIDQKLVSWLQS